MKINILLAALLVIVSTATTAGQWTGRVSISNIIWKPSSHGFYVHSPLLDPEGCDATGNSGNRLYLLDSDLENQEPETTERLYSMLLAAKINERTVNVWVEGCDGLKPIFSGLQLN
jgi:hypothetical protein